MYQRVNNTNFKTIYWYGERYYCGTDVDAEIRTADQYNLELNAKLQQCHANMRTIRNVCIGNRLLPESCDYFTTSALANAGATDCPVPVCFEPASDIACVAAAPCPDSFSYDGGSCDGSGSNIGGCSGSGSSRGRAVGKRNQDIYLPDGVKISHIAEKYDSDERKMIQSDWIARYDQASNMIVRVNDAESVETVETCYETLKHFAQEHDRETYGKNYTPDFTGNVWKNSLFRFYNTVSNAWEPLSSLRE